MTTNARIQMDKKIQVIMDHLQLLMETNQHLEKKQYVLMVCELASKFFGAMSGDDREYLQYAQEAVEYGREWNV